MKGALAALALGAALALSPATATPALAQEIPIHYLEDGGVPVSYRYFTLDTSSYPAEKVRFNGKWRDTGQFVYPLSMSSSVTFPEVGVWTAPDGREHPIDTANLKWSLRAVCVDDDGKVLRTVEDGRTIRMGSTWDFTPQDIEGYTYMGLAEGSAPLKGTITSANMTDQTVTMRYAKRHAVKAVCIDEDGNTLKEPWVIGDGLLRGDEWDVTPPRIADYAFKAVTPDSAPIRGTVDASTPASQTITLVYEIDDSNLTVTVPTVIPFTMGADGHLTSASSGALQIVNGSNFGIHVSGVSVAEQSPFNIVADASKASEDNAVDFQFGVDSALIDAAAPKAKAGSYDLAPTGAAGATLALKAQGDAKNVMLSDLSVETKLADITWTFTVGEAE